MFCEQAAIISGIFSRIIWIWPDWSTDLNKELPSGHFQTTMKVGWYKPSGNYTFFCTCRKNPAGIEECSFTNFTDGWSIQDMATEGCNVMRTVQYDMWRDDLASHQLSLVRNDLQSKRIVLDIDEDFFGCESGATPLVQAGVNWTVVDMLNSALEDLFCPRQLGIESLANRVMRQVIDVMLKKCSWSPGNGACSNYDEIFNDLCSLISVESTKRGNRLAFCAWNGEALCDDFIDVVSALAVFTQDQLIALTSLGFCLSSSLASLPVARHECCIKVCHGVNVPDDTIVMLHRENSDEIEARAERLQFFLKDLSKVASPGVVTIARSARDGFSQRIENSLIESLLLRSLDSVFGRVGVLYDDNLLGGPGGWMNRHRIS